MKSWHAIALSSAVFACESTIIESPGAEGGGGRGGSGSGGDGGDDAVGGTRPMTVRLVHHWHQSPLRDIDVFSNRADGSLIAHTTSDETGVAVLEVVDGGYISTAVKTTDLWESSKPVHIVATIPVLPGLEDVRLLPRQLKPRLEEPMTLSVSWEPVDGALGYEVATSCSYYAQNEQAVPPTVTSIELDGVVGCPGADTFDVTVGAGIDSDPPVVAWAAALDVPYVPGSTQAVRVGGATAEDATVSFRVEGVEPEAIENFDAGRARNGAQMFQFAEATMVATATDVIVSKPVPAFDVYLARGWLDVRSACEMSTIRETRAAPFSTSFDPFRLALATTTMDVDGSWGWEISAEGEIGDAVRLYRSWALEDSGVLAWSVDLPAATQGWGLPTLALPAHLTNDFVPVTDGFVGRPVHVDIVEANDFASFLELLDSDVPHRKETRVELDCEDG